MPPTTSRRPSTLAAGNALAAARAPLGTPIARPGANAAQKPIAPSFGRNATANAISNKDSRKPSRTGPSRLAVKSAAEAKQANWFILGAVALLGMFAAVAGGSRFTDSMEEGKAAVLIEGSLAKVSEQQTQYLSELQRYATWPELEERGARLPARQRVVRSNADKSHWFMRVRDTRTGVECDRIGELVSDATVSVKPSCRTGSGPIELSGI